MFNGVAFPLVGETRYSVAFVPKPGGKQHLAQHRLGSSLLGRDLELKDDHPKATSLDT
jgi:hypothetical protein